VPFALFRLPTVADSKPNPPLFHESSLRQQVPPSFIRLALKICAISATYCEKSRLERPFLAQALAQGPTVNILLTKGVPLHAHSERKGATMRPLEEIIIQMLMGIFALGIAVVTVTVFY